MRLTSIRLLTAAVVASSALVGVGVTPAAALSTYNVTTTADVVDPGDGVLSLREAVDLANTDGDASTVTLVAGQTYDLTLCQLKEPIDTGDGNFIAPADDDANADGDLDHTEAATLTIEGNGAVIRQTCAYDRVLHSLSADSLLVVDNATVRDGIDAPEQGDNIRAMGSLALQNGTMVTNANSFFSGGYAVVVGEGDFDQTRTTSIVDSSVSGNDQSGVLASYGTFDVDNADVSDNGGAGILPDHVELTVTDSTVNNNDGPGVGGVDATVTVVGSEVSHNGRGIGTTGNDPAVAPLTVIDTVVHNNEGGGVSCSYCASVTIDGSTITDNGTIDGPGGTYGGVSVFTFRASPGLSITDSTVSGNRTSGDGGAVNARFPVDGFEAPGYLPTVLIANTDIVDNRSGILRDGGGVHAEFAHVEVVAGSTFVGNWAKPSDVLFGGEGGAVNVVEQGSLTIVDAELSENRAQGDGGAVNAVDLAAVTIDASLVTANEALGSGGGLRVFNTTNVALTDTAVLANTAASSGGGIRVGAPDTKGYDVNLNGSTVADNVATNSIGGGGGIYAHGDKLNLWLFNTTVVGNSTGGSGGGVRVMGGGSVDLDHVTMVGNESKSGAEANLYWQAGEMTAFGTVVGSGLGGGDDCGTTVGSVNSKGYNVSGDASCLFLDATDDQNVIVLGLSPLADNGGSTPTALPASTSPLVNQIPPAACVFGVDQRDAARPDGNNCDVGAVEVPGRGAGPGDFKPGGGSSNDDGRGVEGGQPAGPGRLTTDADGSDTPLAATADRQLAG